MTKKLVYTILVCDIIAIAYCVIDTIIYIKTAFPNGYKYEEFYSDGLGIAMSTVELLLLLIVLIACLVRLRILKRKA